MTMAAATKGVRELEDRGRRHSQRPVAGPAGLAQQFRDIGEPGAGRLSSRLPAGPGSRTNPPAPPARRLGTAVGFAGVTPRAGCGRRRSGGGPPGSGGSGGGPPGSGRERERERERERQRERERERESHVKPVLSLPGDYLDRKMLQNNMMPGSLLFTDPVKYCVRQPMFQAFSSSLSCSGYANI